MNLIKNISAKQFRSQRAEIASKLNSIYFNEASSEATFLVASSAVQVMLSTILSLHKDFVFFVKF